MKIFFLSLILFPFLIFPAVSKNPSTPAIIEEGFIIADNRWVNFRLGYQSYFAQDLVMQFLDFQKEKDFYLRKIKAISNTGLVILNVKERLDLYFETGSYRLEPEFRYGKYLYNSKSQNNIIYRGGASLVVFEIGDFSLGADVHYSAFNASSVFLTRNDIPVNDDLNFKLRQWQISIGLSQKIALLRPYLGISIRNLNIDIENKIFPETLRLTSKKEAGAYVGCSASLGSFFLLNAEIKFVNERSTTFSGEIRF